VLRGSGGSPREAISSSRMYTYIPLFLELVGRKNSSDMYQEHCVYTCTF